MGYDLHITRKSQSSDEEGPVITEAEWRVVIAEDPELELDLESRCEMADGEFVFAAWNREPGALGWYDGEVTAKYPNEALIRKMVQIAEKLNAKVQGDDGEIYAADGSAHQPETSDSHPTAPGMIERIAAWFRRRRNVREPQLTIPALAVGKRVRDPWGTFGTVFEVDTQANGGLGSVRVRLDDGSEQHLSYVASGLEIIEDASSGR
jgi:hypothetical protein